MENKITAVDYIKMVIGSTIADGYSKMRANNFLMLIDKAKEMEEKQLIEEWEKGFNEAQSQGIKEAHKYQ